MNAVNILIAVHDEFLRRGTRAVLECQPEFNVVGESTSWNELTAKALSPDLDVLILDMELLNVRGVEEIRSIMEQHDKVNILAVLKKRDRELIQDVVKAGVAGCLIMKNNGETLVHAIQTVISGKQFLPDEIVQLLVDNEAKSSNCDLTDRERQILQLICRELTNREIAEELQISVRTVDAHRRNLLQKTGARNTAGLVRYAYEHGCLID
ncbi:MAG: response regulator transcription factor [Balneolaceae bacterium]|nr:response regulator transcription factor [Balneolaceae bacterium]